MTREVPTRPSFAFRIDEALDPLSVGEGAIVLMPWKDGASGCDFAGRCARGACLGGRCWEDPTSSALFAALERGEAAAGVGLEFAAEQVEGGHESTLRLWPLRALVPHTPYALILGGGLRDLAGNPLEVDGRAPGSLRLDFMTGRRGSAGPEPRLIWPRPGQRSVPTNLRRVETSYVREVDPGPVLWLESAQGERRALQDPQPCWGTWPGTCWAWSPTGALEGSTRWRIAEGSARDGMGRQSVLPSDGAWFETAVTSDELPPSVSVQAKTRAGCTHWTLEVNEPVRAVVEVPVEATGEGSDDGERSIVEGQGRLELALRGRPKRRVAELRVEDFGGGEVEEELTLEAADPRLDLYISEVLMNPDGPEAEGEFIELVRDPSLGDPSHAYEGLWIADRPWEEVRAELDGGGAPPGDPLPAFELQRGEVALVVADDYELPPELEGVRLLRVGSSIGTSGLANGGEALTLYDPDEGTVWSTYGDHRADLEAGRPLRREPTGACDLAVSWQLGAVGSATPGRLP